MNRLFISFVVSAIVTSFVFFALNDFGITWDEPIYFRNGDRYVKWIKNPIAENIDEAFQANEEDAHPPFRKFVSGITHELMTNNLRILDNTRGYRVAALLFVFPLIALMTYIAIGKFGFVAGPLVSIAFSFMPHVFYLSALSTLDYAVAALWFFAVITGIKGVKSYLWLTVSGIFIGLTMLTKLHGFLLYIPVLGYLIWKKVHIFRLIHTVFLSIIVYVAGWPWLWSTTVAHIQEYFRIQSVHGGIPVYLLGRVYEFAPWWYTPLMFFTTTPLLVLVLFFIGFYIVLRKSNIEDKFILFNAIYPIVFFSLPGVYRYDWIRLFLPAFPFVVLTAGHAVKHFSRFSQTVVVVLFAGTVYTSVIRIHPHESSYYNELAGGMSGAYRSGFETEFWGNANMEILPWMNEHKNVPMCVWPTTHPFYYYQGMGQLDRQIQLVATRDDCHLLVVSMRQGLFFRDPFVGKVVESHVPVHSVKVDGVPLVAVYDIKK